MSTHNQRVRRKNSRRRSATPKRTTGAVDRKDPDTLPEWIEEQIEESRIALLDSFDEERNLLDKRGHRRLYDVVLESLELERDEL